MGYDSRCRRVPPLCVCQKSISDGWTDEWRNNIDEHVPKQDNYHVNDTMSFSRYVLLPKRTPHFGKYCNLVTISTGHIHQFLSPKEKNMLVKVSCPKWRGNSRGWLENLMDCKAHWDFYAYESVLCEEYKGESRRNSRRQILL